MMGLGWQELAVLLVIVVIIFGAGKLPELGSGLGRGIRDFKVQAADDGAPAGVAASTRREGDAARNQASASHELRADQI